MSRDGNSRKKKRRIFDVIRILILLLALCLLLYPAISNYLYERNSTKAVSEYNEEVVKLSDQQREQMLEEARAYNREISGNADLQDPFSVSEKEVDERYESLLNMNSAGMMGYIRIPEIDVELPVYHGTTESVLQVGAGHFQGTSLPVGGESTHTVITGHRGLPSARLFSDLNKVEIGDVFYLKILGEALAYKVDQILTVKPAETEALSIENGKDYATLVTCTPYAVNTHRLLVRGTRIPYEEALKVSGDTGVKAELPIYVKVLIAAFIIILLIFLIVKWTIRRRNR